MEKKNIKLSLVNLETLVLIDLFRRLPQDKIDNITEDDIRNSKIDDQVKSLSSQSCFVKIDFVNEMDEFFKVLSAIQAASPSCFKEVYSIPDKNRSLLFSYRLLETVKKMEIVNSLEEIEIKTEEIIESVIKTGIYKMLNDKFKIIKIDDYLSLLIGKGYRETWDMLNSIKQVFTTFRLFGSFANKDRFSGFVCLFNSDLEEVFKLTQTNIEPFVEDFKHFLEAKEG